jgi:hypothetical protein
MTIAIATMQALVRLTGLVLIVMGVLFWSGRSLTLIPVHMMIGLAFVLSLWALAALVAAAGGSRRLALRAIFWGILVLALGLTQDRLFVGSGHWVIQVLHLLFGIEAIRLGEKLVADVKGGLLPAAQR